MTARISALTVKRLCDGDCQSRGTPESVSSGRLDNVRQVRPTMWTLRRVCAHVLHRPACAVIVSVAPSGFEPRVAALTGDN